jgi:O-succinylbenzoic acid--CoA ligase
METATHISMVPTQLLRQVTPLPQCQCLLVGGAPIGEKTYTKALASGLPVYLSYGMTEIGSMAAVQPPGKTMQPLAHVELCIAKDGEILLNGPSLFDSYFGQEKQHGFFATKDLGVLENGHLRILGRKDAQFISGGENIQPEEIEQALQEIKGVLDAKVHPIDDPEFGQVPIAEIHVEEVLDLKTMRQKLEERLPRFKIPKQILQSLLPLKSAKIIEDIPWDRD